MPEPLRTHLDDFDFAGEMKNLANQAEAKATGAVRMDRNDLLLALGQMLRPLAFELESVKRQNAEMATLLTALGKNVTAQTATPASQVIDNISQQLQRIGSVESANQKLFDALHAELKGYKDNFLFDALQKPFIRDLVSLFDDFTSVHEQALARLEKLRAAPPEKPGKGNDKKRETAATASSTGDEETEQAFLQNLAGNVENQLHHMIEVFLRMDVELSRTTAGAPVDKRTHRTVGFDPAATPEDDGVVARSVKPGFAWRDRPIRPEEIVARRWKPLAPPVPASPPATELVPPPADDSLSTPAPTPPTQPTL